MSDNLLWTESNPLVATKRLASADLAGLHLQKLLSVDPTTPATQLRSIGPNSNPLVGGVAGAGDVMVRRKVSTFIFNPAVTAGVAYTAGDGLGGLMQLTNVVAHTGGYYKVRSIQVISKSANPLPLELVMFNASPTDLGDKQPYNLINSLLTGIGVLEGVFRIGGLEDERLVQAVWTNNVPTGVPSAANGQAPAPEMHLSVQGTSAFARLVLGPAATPNFTATTDLFVKIVTEAMS